MGTTDVAWTPLRWPGIEHAVVSAGSAGHRLAGLVLLVQDQRPFRVRYRISTDAGWRVRRLRVAVRGPGAAAAGRLDLRADGAGNWTGAQGSVPELHGCVDVDLSLTPLTNTLPIRRLGLGPGEGRDLRVGYVELPELKVSAMAQRYTCLGEGGYRYESPGFEATLPVDEGGVVRDYPGLWRRIPLR